MFVLGHEGHAYLSTDIRPCDAGCVCAAYNDKHDIQHGCCKA